MSNNETTNNETTNKKQILFAKDTELAKEGFQNSIQAILLGIVETGLSLNNPELLAEFFVKVMTKKLENAGILMESLSLTEKQQNAMLGHTQDAMKLAIKLMQDHFDSTKKITEERNEELRKAHNKIVWACQDLAIQPLSTLGGEIRKGLTQTGRITNVEATEKKQQMKIDYYGDASIPVPSNVFIISDNATEIINNICEEMLEKKD